MTEITLRLGKRTGNGQVKDGEKVKSSRLIRPLPPLLNSPPYANDRSKKKVTVNDEKVEKNEMNRERKERANFLITLRKISGRKNVSGFRNGKGCAPKGTRAS